MTCTVQEIIEGLNLVNLVIKCVGKENVSFVSN